MASFTDELVAFNPYIPKIPVDDYVRVGMMKQQQYNEGVQKVQSYIDSVAGLDVVKPEQKEYLQQRVGQLQGEISKVVSQDFSNNQLVNSVGNLTNKIAGDPVIQSAVYSTQRYRQGLADMKEAKDKGLNSPSNDYVFNQSVQNWLGDGDVSSNFNGEYEKYTDTKKPILEAINALKPGANITDIPYETDAQGNFILDKNGDRKVAYATLREKLEGVSEGRVRQAIEASITPQMKRQFQIDGQYNYRGIDKAGLKATTQASYNNRLEKMADIVQGLTTQLNGSQNDDNAKRRIQAQIAQYQAGAKDLISQYGADIKFLDQNPEGYKGELHYQDEIAKYTLGYAWSKHSLTYENNPVFNGVMKEKEYNLNWDKFKETAGYHRDLLAEKYAELGIKAREAEIREEALRLKYGIKSAGQGQFGLDAPTLGPIPQEVLESVNLSTFQKEVDNMSNDLDQQRMKMIGQLPGGQDWIENRDGNLIYKDAKAKDAAETAVKTLKAAYDKDSASVSPAAQTYFGNFSNQDGIIQNFKATADKIVKEADQRFPTTPLTKNLTPLSVQRNNGQKYTMSTTELVDLAKKYSDYVDKNQQPTLIGPTGAPMSRAPISEAATNSFMAGLSEKERDIISTYMKNDGAPQSEQINNLFNRAVRNVVSPESRKLASDRAEYIKEESRRAYLQQEQQENPIISYKSADRERAKANFVQIINDQKAAGKSNPNPLFDESDISNMLDKKNFANTNYSLVTRPDGTHAVRFSNTTITDRPVEMDITDKQAEIWFGSFVNQFKPIQQAINLSKYRGTGATTDVRGLGKESAYNIPQTQQLSNYSVKYHVEEPYPGQYQVKLYIYDKNAKQWLPDRYADFGGRMLTPEQVTKAVNGLSDAEIKRITGDKTTTQAPTAPAFYSPQGDPNVDKRGILGDQEENTDINQEDNTPEEDDSDNS